MVALKTAANAIVGNARLEDSLAITELLEACGADAPARSSVPQPRAVSQSCYDPIFLITVTAAYKPATLSLGSTRGGYAAFSGCNRINSSPPSLI